ncbi:hypothetical protein RJ55_05926 [Drechmeria coniospora]|nr:hypothetical protein RJ55_05926 [Drechmeria coniospora]
MQPIAATPRVFHPSSSPSMQSALSGLPPATAPAALESPFAALLRYGGASYSSSAHQFPSDITDPILEEGGHEEESGSDSPLEPVTPVSGGRHSQDFTTLHPGQVDDDSASSHPRERADQAGQNPPSSAAPKTAPLLASPTSTTPPPTSTSRQQSPPASGQQSPPTSRQQSPPASTPRTPGQPDPCPSQAPLTPASRRSTRGSTSRLKRTMSSLFRRSNSLQEKEREQAIVDLPSLSTTDTTNSSIVLGGSVGTSSGDGVLSSTNKSSTTTRSSSPPSPGSPVEMAPTHAPTHAPMTMTNGALPNPDDFKKKARAATVLTLRGRAVNFVGATMGRGRQPPQPAPARRASSFDSDNRGLAAAQGAQADEEKTYPPERLPWAIPPDAGTGAKARRMSLSLPDDFTVDVAELQSEFEYLSKLLGRHGKHLGKGAASKVTLMVRKGCPTELYAVKEFRGKSHRESQEEYEKKIKSEFSIAKSIHHPNIVETIRLCTDHNRWNHVMEYCSEGDLFSLVQKGHLKGEEKKKDRLCLFKQLIQGVGYLHANGIAHRDIKLENLLLTKDSKLKITDFGVSEVFSGTHPGLRESGGQCGQNMGDVRLCSPGICGSEPYIAPEVLAKADRYDARALDVWSSAIVMIYLTFGGAIWSRAERGNLHYDKLVQGWEKWYRKHPECDACITDTDYPACLAFDMGINPPALRRLLLQMLNPNPSKRISIEDVLGNRWVKNIECCQLESYDDPAQLIDAAKKDSCSKLGSKKIFCHSHLPPKSTGSHSLGKMPGQPGY